ncbi:unnamed protein product [Trichobilharzia regenti]|nr:unnamed protein product [Trichobilharzia regenti]
MLEWLLSEEADLCILPPSLCQSKDTDKLHHQQQPQQTSLGISPLPSSVYNASISPITTSLNSNTSVGVGDGGGGATISTNNSGNTTTSTTTITTTTTNLLLSNSTINSTFTELRRSSPQPRTESLLVVGL